MYYQLQRLGMCTINQKGYHSQFTGSSKFKVRDNKIMSKDYGKDKTKDLEAPIIKEVKEKKQKTVKSYGLRKSKIRNKILNFFQLNKSKKFCAFYSISFPIEITDEVAYKVLNTWLTRCRKDCGLKSYLWVAERQKNNTIHFHLITNNRMEIKVVNEFMKSCLMTQFLKGNLNCKKSVIDKYNGCDVDNLYYSKRNKNSGKRLLKADSQRKLSYYLTKYISKNDTQSSRLPWHCSRDISALFISINYSDVSNLEIANLICDNPDAVATYKQEYFTMHYFKFIPDEFHFADLSELNNFVVDNFYQN